MSEHTARAIQELKTYEKYYGKSLERGSLLSVAQASALVSIAESLERLAAFDQDQE